MQYALSKVDNVPQGYVNKIAMHIPLISVILTMKVPRLDVTSSDALQA